MGSLRQRTMTRPPLTLLITLLSALSAGIVQALVEDEQPLSASISGDGIRSVMDGTTVAIRQGFSPKHCARGEAPPAELLSLADWPLDERGTCVKREFAMPAPSEDPGIQPVLTIVEVLEATIQPVSRRADVVEATIRPVSRNAEVVEATIRPVSRSAEVVEATMRPDSGNAMRLKAGGETAIETLSGHTARKAEPYGDTPGIIPTNVHSHALGHDYDNRGTAAETLAGPALPALMEQQHVRPSAHSSSPSRTAPPRGPLRPLRLAEAPTIADSELDTLRGGFETPSGLRVSFGIERAVFVNGVLASVTTVNVADLGQLSGRGLPEGSTVAVIQNGPNNTFVGNALNAGALATVIQNSLDNQNIRAVTTINATVNSMEMLRSGQMTHSLRDAMVHSLMR